MVDILTKEYPAGVLLNVKWSDGHKGHEDYCEGEYQTSAAAFSGNLHTWYEIIDEGTAPKFQVWEAGGGMTKTGSAVIVCSTSGTPLKPNFVASSGHLACGDHARFEFYLDECFSTVEYRRGDADAYVRWLQVTGEGQAECYLEEKVALSDLELPEVDNNGVYNDTAAVRFRSAIEAAVDKSSCYHCREPHFVF